MLRVYIASPYTNGNKQANVRRQIYMAECLVAAGLLPCWPLSSHYWDLYIPHTYEYWMALDREEIKRCNALLRLSGESSGADQEVEWAKEFGIPVFYEFADVVTWSKNQSEKSEECHLDHLRNANFPKDWIFTAR